MLVCPPSVPDAHSLRIVAGFVTSRGASLVDALFASCPMNVGAKRLYSRTPAAKSAARAVFAAVLKHCPLFYGDILATGVRAGVCCRSPGFTLECQSRGSVGSRV